MSWIHKKSLMSSIKHLGDVLHDNQDIAAISQVHSVTVNTERYNHMLETFFVPEMRHHNWNMARAWFQQDGATAHMA
jgi:hypothetical protein